jgi:hypothetical protein
VITPGSEHQGLYHCVMSSIRITDHLIAEHDPDLGVTGGSSYRFDTGFFGRCRVGAVDVVLELAHQEEKAHDRDGPQHEDDEQEQSVGHPVDLLRR